MAQLDWHMDDIGSAHVESQAELLTADAMQMRSSIDVAVVPPTSGIPFALQSIHHDEQSGLTIRDLSSHHSPFAARACTLSDADTGSSASDDATLEGSLHPELPREAPPFARHESAQSLPGQQCHRLFVLRSLISTRLSASTSLRIYRP